MTCIGTQLQRQQAAPEKVYKSSNLSSMHAPMQLFRMRTARCHRPKPSSGLKYACRAFARERNLIQPAVLGLNWTVPNGVVGT